MQAEADIRKLPCNHDAVHARQQRCACGIEWSPALLTWSYTGAMRLKICCRAAPSCPVTNAPDGPGWSAGVATARVPAALKSNMSYATWRSWRPSKVAHCSECVRFTTADTDCLPRVSRWQLRPPKCYGSIYICFPLPHDRVDAASLRWSTRRTQWQASTAALRDVGQRLPAACRLRCPVLRVAGRNGAKADFWQCGQVPASSKELGVSI